jgi:hypothetical protein
MSGASNARPSQSHTLKHGPFILIVGLGGFLLFSGFLLLASLYPNDTGAAWVNAVFAAFAALGLFLVYAYLRDKLTITNEGISGRGMFSSPRSVRWQDVTEIRFDQNMGWFIVRSFSARPLYVSRMLIGLPEFARAATIHVSPSVMEPGCLELLEFIRTQEAGAFQIP